MPPELQGFEKDFQTILSLINDAKEKAWQSVNKTLIELYWAVGQHISEKSTKSGWGMSSVESLGSYIQKHAPSSKGFSARNIWRMKQFYETYASQPNLSALLTQISWTNHLHILSKTKSFEEKYYYLDLVSKTRYSERALARLIESGSYERTLLADQKLSAVLTEFSSDTRGVFKDSYVFEFLGLSEPYEENDLRKALLKNLKNFLLEMGPDFSFIGEEYRVQVGMRDFRIDLLMHHRGLNCLVAIELKVTEFEPEHLGKMQFYLEALDQDVKKLHESPSIGILICKTKDDEVVKYSLAKNIAPAVVAEYETKLIDKKLLQRKIHEISNLLESKSAPTD